MPKAKTDPIVLGKFNKMLDLFNAKQGNVAIDAVLGAEITPGDRFSPHELHRISSSHSRTIRKTTDTSSIMNELLGQKRKSDVIASKINMIKTSCPEIQKAAEIVIPSIISPNDMMGKQVGFDITRTDSISEESYNKIIKILSDYFNNTYKFGVKLEEWLYEIMYEHGSKAICVMAKSALKNINAIAKGEYIVSHEDTCGIPSSEFDTVFSAESLISEFERTDMYKEMVATFEDINENAKKKNLSNKKEKLDASLGTLIKDTMKSIVDKKDFIVATENPEVLLKKVVTETAVREKNKQLARKDLFSADANEQLHKVIYIEDDKEEISELPIILDFPTESVIPVYVPGSPKEHIGYFVVVDGSGIGVSASHDFYSPNTTASVLNNANTTMHGIDASTFTGFYHDSVKKSIFDISINRLIKSKLDDMGMVNLDIGLNDAISKNIFNQVIEDRKIQFVYIPEPMMIYYRFAHRENGTGKSDVENVEFIASIRAAILVANTLRTLNNAVEYQKISVRPPKDEQNIEDVLSMIQDAYMDKYSYGFSLDPNTIARHVVSKSLSVNIDGDEETMGGLGIESTTEQKSTSNVDESFSEGVDQLLILGLSVPPSALNQLSETEYSRSVATQNIFFSNNIIRRQETLQTPNDKYIRRYVSCCMFLIKKISNVLLEDPIVREKMGIKEKETIDLDNFTATENCDIDLNSIVQEVISNITTILPKPNITSIKSQYDDIESFKAMLDSIFDQIYSDEMIGDGDDDVSKEMITALRAIFKSKSMISYLQKAGFNFIDNIDLDNVDIIESFGSIQHKLINAAAILKDKKAALDASEGEDSDDDSY